MTIISVGSVKRVILQKFAQWKCREFKLFLKKDYDYQPIVMHGFSRRNTWIHSKNYLQYKQVTAFQFRNDTVKSFTTLESGFLVKEVVINIVTNLMMFVKQGRKIQQ